MDIIYYYMDIVYDDSMIFVLLRLVSGVIYNNDVLYTIPDCDVITTIY